MHFTKTTGAAIKNKQQKLRLESSLTCSFTKNGANGMMEESYQDDINDDNHSYENVMDTCNDGLGEFLYLEITRILCFAILDGSMDDFRADLPLDIGVSSPTKELDESQQYFEPLEQVMAENTESAKVCSREFTYYTLTIS